MTEEGNKIRFFHVRRYTNGVEVINGEQFIAYYLSEKGGCTFAAHQNPEFHNVIEFTMARCSKKDNFCRKVGRNIAQTRLRSDKAHKHFFSGNMEEFAEFVYNEVKV